jgi:hypothetical protein
MRFILPSKNLKLFLLILIGALMTGCDNPNGDGSDKKGSDEKMKSESVAPVQKEPPKLVYDSAGNITERHSISYRQKDNSIRSRDSYYYKYDNRRNVVEETKKSFDPDGNLVFRIVNFYFYNDLNQKTEQKFYSYDANDSLKQEARNTYVYDKSGNVTQEKNWNPDGTIKAIINSSRSEEGYLTSEEYINYNPDGTKKSHKKFYYSKFGLERTEDLMKK